MKHTLTLALVYSLTGCAHFQPAHEVRNPYPPVPPLLNDTPSLPPVTGERLIWQPGHYDWTGSAYAWVQGRYMKRSEAPSDVWMPGYWRDVKGTWAWAPGHWE